jgi:hypothetical protein
MTEDLGCDRGLGDQCVIRHHQTLSIESTIDESSAGSSAGPLSQPHFISDVPPYLRPSVKLDGGRVIL